MTAQEIYEREGFLIMGANRPLKLGEPYATRTNRPDSILEVGTLVVPIEQVTKKVALDYATKYERKTLMAKLKIEHFLFYKVIAE